jgi:hypothetical protein
MITVVLFSCQSKKAEKQPESQPQAKSQASKMSIISDPTIKSTIDELVKKYGETQKFRIERGVKQAAGFWKIEDGTIKDFTEFCVKNFIADSASLDATFQTIERNSENIFGNMNRITLGLRYPVDVEIGNISDLDQMFAAYSPSSHITDDFFKNKIAFVVLLNFPYYSLKEKNEFGANWTRKQWAYARIGDMFTSRVPAELAQKYSEVNSASENYISNYNIYMGNLIDPNGKVSFPKEMKLISHWNLRDELKANYASPEGLDKQKMIYTVMQHIVLQDIPEIVINNDSVTWDPVTNKVMKNGKEIKSNPEPCTRYKKIIDNFKALSAMDYYNPYYPTYISRQFDASMEMSFDQIEKMFTEFISVPQINKTAELIRTRLGRNLEPFDIWYDGFKSRSSMNQDEINKKLAKLYPTSTAFAKDLPNILKKLEFSSDKAKFVSDKVFVDPSRGAGHAWGAQLRGEKAHLRTRVGKDGMDYKGYNIAIHEFGHNVEQTFSLYNIDYYALAGVPNNAFTEAMAFIFQHRDLTLLGYKNIDKNKNYYDVLDNLWSAYEIMGVSLVDMYTWKWLYENPKATPEQLRDRVVKISKEVWNKYYAGVMGSKDSPILGIYSHMISNPLYLAAYPIGHLIEFQVEQYITGKDFGKEIERIESTGRLVPEWWMKKAVNAPLSIQLTLTAAENALNLLNSKK